MDGSRVALRRCAIVAILAVGLVASSGCGSDDDMPSKADFVAQMKKVLESPPSDDVLTCMYAGLEGDTAFARDLMADSPSDTSRTRMRRINASCVLNPTGRGVSPGPVDETTSTTTASEPGPR